MKPPRRLQLNFWFDNGKCKVGKDFSLPIFFVGMFFTDRKYWKNSNFMARKDGLKYF